MSEQLLANSLTSPLLWWNKLLEVIRQGFFQAENQTDKILEEELSLEEILSAPPAQSDEVKQEERAGGFGHDLHRVSLVVPPAQTPSLTDIAVFIKNERIKLSELTADTEIASGKIAEFHAHLLIGIHRIQSEFDDLLTIKQGIHPILHPFSSKTFLAHIITGIDSVINLLQPLSVAHFLKINTDINARDILHLKTMMGEQEQAGVIVLQKAQQVAMDIAAKMTGKSISDFAQTHAILNDNQPLAKTQPLYQELHQAIEHANTIKTFFDKVHILFDQCNDLANEFQLINTQQALLQDMKAQIEGRTENLNTLEQEYQPLLTPLKLSEVLSNSEDGPLSLFDQYKALLSGPHSPAPAIHLEIPGFSAEQQLVHEAAPHLF